MHTLLIAVLLSAQSTDVRVNQITPLLFEKAHAAEDMVETYSRRNSSYYSSCWAIPHEI